MDTATASALPQVAFEDGLGQRRQIVGAGNQPLTLLVLDNDLTGLPSFEAALRERIDQLTGFHHPAYARVRGIAHLARVPSSLALASDFVSGARLSDILAVAERRLIPLEIEGAYCLIRQLVPAVAALHERLPYGCHGALAPERLIITPDAHLVVVEHVLATALEQLRFSHERYWKQFRIALPPSGAVPRFDRRADVMQLGTLALALILGRPLGDNEFPDRIEEIVDGVRAISSTGLELLPPGVHSWLRRALQLEGERSFATAIEAHAELDRVVAADETRYRRALETFLAQCYEALPQTEIKPAGSVVTPPQPSRVAPQSEDRNGSRPVAVAAPPSTIHAVPAPGNGTSPFQKNRPAAAEKEAPARVEPPATPSAASPAPKPVAAAVSPAPQPVAAASVAAPVTRLSVVQPPAESTSEEKTTVQPERSAVATPGVRDSHTDSRQDEAWEQPEDQVPNRTAWGRGRMVAAAVVLIALASVATLGARMFFTGDAAGTLVVNTNPAGVAVVVDGQRLGTTPATVQLAPGDHVLTLASGDQSRTIPLTIAEGAQVSQFIEFPTTAPVSQTGRIQIRTEPAGANVIVDGQPRGAAPLVVEGLTPGVHVVRLENAIGSVTEQVTVEAGGTASLVVPLGAPAGVPVSGWISVAAPVDVQVYQDGRLIGSSRTERIMMPVGRHELEIVNEALGYRMARVVQVTPGATAAVRLDWPRGSLALNAQPWAEVWLNGQRLGETPIGNVQVPIGTHQVTFRHPELGEQTHTVTVTLTGPARVSADLRSR